MRECYDEFGQKILRLTQWDLNRVVTIQDFEYEETPIVHFAHINDKESLVVTGDDVTLVNGELKVKVPNELLWTSESILMNIFVYNRETNKGINVDNILLPVQAKPQPNGYIYENNSPYYNIGEIYKEILEIKDLMIEEINSIEMMIDESGVLV